MQDVNVPGYKVIRLAAQSTDKKFHIYALDDLKSYIVVHPDGKITELAIQCRSITNTGASVGIDSSVPFRVALLANDKISHLDIAAELGKKVEPWVEWTINDTSLVAGTYIAAGSNLICSCIRWNGKMYDLMEVTSVKQNELVELRVSAVNNRNQLAASGRKKDEQDWRAFRMDIDPNG
jgi:hypothetical protein